MRFYVFSEFHCGRVKDVEFGKYIIMVKILIVECGGNENTEFRVIIFKTS